MKQQQSIDAADLFCGAGGTSQGLLMAANKLNRKLELIAVNHWQVAIDTHALNHAEARNLCTGLEEVQPHKLIPGGRLDLLCASPECTHHSVARGGKPMDDQSRSSAWLILQWAQQLYIKAMIFENVPEWVSWGPLGANGKPLKSKKGELFQAFVAMLRALGYKVEWRVLNCADYGSPTTRRRLFMICRRDGKPIRWPEPTHVAPAKKSDPIPMFPDTRPNWRTAREIIDWSLKSKSIFGRRKPLADNTLRRIEAGLLKFNGLRLDLRKCMKEDLRPYLLVPPGASLGEAKPFLLPHRVKDGVHNIDEPLRTVTATSSDFAIANPFLLQIDHASGSGSVRSVDTPVATLVTKENTAVAEPFLTILRGASTVADIENPAPTVTTKGAHFGLIEPFLIGQQGGATPRPVTQPVPTVATDGAISLTQPFLSVLRGTGKTAPIDDPLHTVTASGNHYGLTEAFLTTAGGTVGQGRTPKSLDEPMGTVLTNDRRALASAFLVDPNFGERPGQSPRNRSVDRPAPTVTSTGAGGVVEPFIVTVNHGDGLQRRTRSVDEPMSTVTGSMGEGIAQPSLVQFYGSSTVSGVDEPIPTVTCKDRFGVMIPELIEMDFAGLVELGWMVYLLDIHFRMLQPRELARAQGFPDTYRFTGNREDTVKQIGNAVPPDVAAALCYAVLEETFRPRNRTDNTLEEAA